MNDIDINLYYNRYRLDALERVLHSQGKSIEDAVYPMLDTLYEQLVPAEDVMEWWLDEKRHPKVDADQLSLFSDIENPDAT